MDTPPLPADRCPQSHCQELHRCLHTTVQHVCQRLHRKPSFGRVLGWSRRVCVYLFPITVKCFEAV